MTDTATNVATEAKPAGGHVGISAEQHAKALSQNQQLQTKHEALQAELAALRSDQKTSTAAAGDAKKADDAVRAAKADAATSAESATSAWEVVKTTLTQQALGGFKDPSYAALAPPVQLTEDRKGLTEDSQKALAKFRVEHASLFTSKPGSTPTSVGSGTQDGHFDAETQQAFALNNVDPAETRKSLNRPGLRNVAAIIGTGAVNRMKV